MDFSFTSDQLLIRDTVRQFMQTEVRPRLREYDRTEKFPGAEIRRLGELGCCGMLIPEEWGGAGTDTISYALMLEEVARVDASIAVALSVTNSVAAVPIWNIWHRRSRRKSICRGLPVAKFWAASASPNRKQAPTRQPSRRAHSLMAACTC